VLDSQNISTLIMVVFDYTCGVLYLIANHHF